MKKIILLLITTAAFGCSENPKTDAFQLTRRPQELGVVTQKGSAESAGGLDVLFVVDNSGSMSDEQENLRDNMDQFVAALLSRLSPGVTLNFAVTSAEMPTRDMSYQEALSVLYTSFDDSEVPFCFDGANLVENNCPLASLTATEDKLTPFISIQSGSTADLDPLKRRILLGDDASGTEAAGLAALLALRRESDNPTGFLNKDNHLAIVAITDAAENSGLTPAEFRNEILALKDGDEDRVFSILVFAPPSGFPGLQFCSGETDGDLSILPELYGSFKNSRLLGVCDPLFGQELAEIGEFISDTIASEFILEQIPVIDSIEVFLNGVQLANDAEDGWVYNPLNNTVKVTHRPPKGSTVADFDIEVKYQHFVLADANDFASTKTETK